jgi:hypothetical protein
MIGILFVALICIAGDVGIPRVRVIASSVLICSLGPLVVLVIDRQTANCCTAVIVIFGVGSKGVVQEGLEIVSYKLTEGNEMLTGS